MKLGRIVLILGSFALVVGWLSEYLSAAAGAAEPYSAALAACAYLSGYLLVLNETKKEDEED